MTTNLRYLLDTHVWVWMLMESGRLSAKARKILTQTGPAKPSLLISAISLVEVGMLLEKNRLQIDAPLEVWLRDAHDEVAVDILPISNNIALRAASLPGFNHFDPSDRIIVATALAEKVPLITADRVIQGYKSVHTIWK